MEILRVLPSCLATIPRAKRPSSYDQAVTGPSKNSMHSTLRKTKDFIADQGWMSRYVPIRRNQWTDRYMEDEMTKGSIDPLDQIQARNVTKDLFVRNRKKATALFFNMERWRVGCSPDGETCRSFAAGKSADGQNGRTVENGRLLASDW